MPALLAFLVVSVLTGIAVARWTQWQRPPSRRRPTVDLADVARKQQSVLSSLAGFAVTSLVLLITFSGTRLDVRDEGSISLIALLVVAYLGFVVGAIMYAHVEPIVAADGTDLLAAQHITASCQFYRSIVSGWLALGPLVAFVGSPQLTAFVLALLLLAVLGGWIFHAANLVALGFADWRMAVLSPSLALAGAFAYVLLVQAAPALRSPDTILVLVGAGAVMGAAAHGAFHGARLLGIAIPEHVLRHLRAIASWDAHASLVLTTFMWLAVAGLI